MSVLPSIILAIIKNTCSNPNHPPEPHSIQSQPVQLISEPASGRLFVGVTSRLFTNNSRNHAWVSFPALSHLLYLAGHQLGGLHVHAYFCAGLFLSKGSFCWFVGWRSGLQKAHINYFYHKMRCWWSPKGGSLGGWWSLFHRYKGEGGGSTWLDPQRSPEICFLWVAWNWPREERFFPEAEILNLRSEVRWSPNDDSLKAKTTAVMILRILRENMRTSCVTLLQQKWRRRRPKSVWSGAKPADPSFNRRSWSVFIYVCNTSRGIVTAAVALRRHASLSSSRHCALIHNANNDVLANTVFASPFTTPPPPSSFQEASNANEVLHFRSFGELSEAESAPLGRSVPARCTLTLQPGTCHAAGALVTNASPITTPWKPF